MEKQQAFTDMEYEQPKRVSRRGLNSVLPFPGAVLVFLACVLAFTGCPLKTISVSLLSLDAYVTAPVKGEEPVYNSI
jgi:hypothetical protein